MVWPLTIIADRYCGTYSGGVHLAWNLEPDEIPGEVFAGDLTCGDFWAEGPSVPVGKGDTPDKALADLALQLARGPARQPCSLKGPSAAPPRA